MMINVDFIYPIGSIYETTSNITPDVLFGGQWQRYGNGRVAVGVDENDTDFNEPGKCGGSKYLQQHRHVLDYGCGNVYLASGGVGHWLPIYGSDPLYTWSTKGCKNISNNLDVPTGDSGNLQPYFCVYRYRRIG